MGGIKQKRRRNNRNNKKNKLKKDKTPQKHDIEKETDEASDVDEVDSSNEDPVPQNVSRKRELNEDDSDTEDKPKRKKKKKPVVTESTDKKGKKSIRQMKREKFAERQAEAEAAAKDGLKSQCLNYISQWKHDKQNWKFMKAKQVWLNKNKFSSLIPDESWPLLLEYFESAQGNIRNMLLEDATKIIKQMDDWTEKNGKSKEKEEEEEEELDDEESDKPDSTSYKRARDLIQSLQE